MSWSKAFDVLWRIAMGLMVIKFLVDLRRDGHFLFGVAMVVLPLGGLMVLRARAAARARLPVIGGEAGERPEIFRQLAEPDQMRIAELAASGRGIEAIRLTRELLHIGLRAAKEAVDQLPAPRRGIQRF